MDAADVAGVGPIDLTAGSTVIRNGWSDHSDRVGTICIQIVCLVVDIVCEQFFISGIKLILLIPIDFSFSHPKVV